MSEVKDSKVIEMETVESNVEVETKSEGLLSKAKEGLKKHGKAVAIIAACVVGGMIGYALGNKKSGNDSDVIDVDDCQYIETADDAASGEVTED